MAIPLKRTTFTTNRVLEFFSEKELNMQLGHSRAMWPIALLKELLDNALDAADLAGVVARSRSEKSEEGDNHP